MVLADPNFARVHLSLTLSKVGSGRMTHHHSPVSKVLASYAELYDMLCMASKKSMGMVSKSRPNEGIMSYQQNCNVTPGHQSPSCASFILTHLVVNVLLDERDGCRRARLGRTLEGLQMAGIVPIQTSAGRDKICDIPASDRA